MLPPNDLAQMPPNTDLELCLTPPARPAPRAWLRLPPPPRWCNSSPILVPVSLDVWELIRTPSLHSAHHVCLTLALLEHLSPQPFLPASLGQLPFDLHGDGTSNRYAVPKRSCPLPLVTSLPAHAPIKHTAPLPPNRQHTPTVSFHLRFTLRPLQFSRLVLSISKIVSLNLC